MVRDEDPYGIWCAIASDLGKAIKIFKEIGLKDDYIRSELVDLVNKCMETK